MEHQQAYRAAVDGKHRANKTSRLAEILAYPAAADRGRRFVCGLDGRPSQAQSGPFAGLAGSWNGGGTVTLDDGSTERIRCRAISRSTGPPWR